MLVSPEDSDFEVMESRCTQMYVYAHTLEALIVWLFFS